MTLEASFTQYPYCFQEDSKVKMDKMVKMVATDLVVREELVAKVEQVSFAA